MFPFSSSTQKYQCSNIILWFWNTINKHTILDNFHQGVWFKRISSPKNKATLVWWINRILWEFHALQHGRIAPEGQCRESDYDKSYMRLFTKSIIKQQLFVLTKSIINQQQWLVFEMNWPSLYLLKLTEKFESKYPGIGHTEVFRLFGRWGGRRTRYDSIYKRLSIDGRSRLP